VYKDRILTIKESDGRIHAHSEFLEAYKIIFINNDNEEIIVKDIWNNKRENSKSDKKYIIEYLLLNYSVLG
jgi:predicted Fe-Mo cluster-binding NifX family protein